MINLNQCYSKQEVKRLREEYYPNNPLVMSFDNDNFMMKFSCFEFTEQLDKSFMCTKNTFEVSDSPKIHIKSDKKTKKFWKKDCPNLREFQKYGYKPNG